MTRQMMNVDLPGESVLVLASDSGVPNMFDPPDRPPAETSGVVVLAPNMEEAWLVEGLSCARKQIFIHTLESLVKK